MRYNTPPRPSPQGEGDFETPPLEGEVGRGA